jgi:exosortase
LLLGVVAIVGPTMFDVARLTWTTEQGGHAPIIVATGAWLLYREVKSSRVRPWPGKLWPGVPALALCLAVYVVSRITGILELESLSMYGSLVAAAYVILGGALLRAAWFPIIYLVAALPPPDTVVSLITQPLKIAISQSAVLLLHGLGYPIASSGVTIQIANYQLLVAAACAGLNSILTLSAICLFYVYLRHRSDLIAFTIVAALIVPVAVFSNFVRVVALVLITYYLGEAAAQGFLHDFAGLTLFLVALVSIIGLDSLITSFRQKGGA